MPVTSLQSSYQNKVSALGTYSKGESKAKKIKIQNMLDVDKYYRGNEVKVDKDTLAQKGFLGRSGKTSTEQHLSKDLQEVRE